MVCLECGKLHLIYHRHPHGDWILRLCACNQKVISWNPVNARVLISLLGPWVRPLILKRATGALVSVCYRCLDGITPCHPVQIPNGLQCQCSPPVCWYGTWGPQSMNCFSMWKYTDLLGEAAGDAAILICNNEVLCGLSVSPLFSPPPPHPPRKFVTLGLPTIAVLHHSQPLVLVLRW